MCLPEFLAPPSNLNTFGTPADDQRLQITTGGIDLTNENNFELFDQVIFQYGNRSLSAESATYNTETKDAQVHGTVTYQDTEVTIYGNDAEFDTQEQIVAFSAGAFELTNRTTRGSGSTITIENDNTISLNEVDFTTCPEILPDWQLLARELDMNIDQGFGTARGVRLNFKGVPIFAAPYMTFPIDDRRKSGLLTPNISNRDRTGLDISMPYYLNLAPNYDMTITPRYMRERGGQITSEFRYLSTKSQAQVDFEYVPRDSILDLSRSYLNIEHETNFAAGWRLVTNAQHVSDVNYFEDLGDSLSVASQTHLDRHIDLSYRRENWSLLARMQQFQTIDPMIDDQNEPYKRVPQFVFSGRWNKGHFRFKSDNELVNFDRPIGATGWRMDLNEEIAFPLKRPGMFLTTALALRQTNYWLNEKNTKKDTEFSRTLPVASIDAGLTLDRLIGKEKNWLQTIEPRLLYVNIPFEDQTNLPVFDTIEPTFNLVQLFRKYRYVGPDRIADVDRLSYGVTTRLINNNTGAETLTGTLGRTRHFRRQKVSLPGYPASLQNDSDYIAEVALNLNSTWRLGLDYQWDSETNKTVRSETRLQYRPESDRLLGLAYRSQHGFLKQGDISVVWPIGQAWRVIGQTSYSLLDRKPLQRYLGWEYESCCWRLRLVGKHYISRRTGESDSSFTVQFQLKGFTDDSESPEELLDRGILGYQQFDMP
ncbi:MAG: hypothetical protein CMM56_07850 [Rhodospirillaceae bacterium]|nr:hypothetical protein [Rhodospirillaceae bacterium]